MKDEERRPGEKTRRETKEETTSRARYETDAGNRLAAPSVQNCIAGAGTLFSRTCERRRQYRLCANAVRSAPN